MKISKKFGLVVFLFCFFVSFSFAGAQDLKGTFLLQVQDKGRIWYVNPNDNLRYEVKSQEAFDLFKSIAKEVTEKDLKNIPRSLRGKILFQKEKNKYWYVALNGFKYELTSDNLLSILKKVSVGINNETLNKIVPGNIYNVGKPSNNTIDLSDQYFSRFVSSWNLLKQKYAGSFDGEKAIQGAIDGLVKSLGDEYTSFFTPTSSKNFEDSLSGSFEGIGVEINVKDRAVTILSVLPNTPAKASGLIAGDKIISIDGKSTENLNLDNVSSMIRGKSGTTVLIKVLRGNDQYEYSITRGSIHYDSVMWSMKADNIAYINIKSFNTDTSELMKKAVAEILLKNPKGVILDLRGNPGGYLESAISVSSHWVENNIVVRERTKDQLNTQDFYSSGIAKLKNIKTVVLVNESSASASEIVSGALQDYKLATIVGEKTYGKGSVQDISSLSDGSSIKITIAKWYTPYDRSIDKIGITPDIEVLQPNVEIGSGNDVQLNKALELLK